MDERKNIRPIYNELQGYLSQSPQIGEHGKSVTSDETLWNQLNSTIDELNELTGENFNKFKITGFTRYQSDTEIAVTELRTKLGGLIARLHGTYFSDEPAPFSGMPSTSITLSNQQHQRQEQSVLVEFSLKLDEKIKSQPEGPEKSFLSELKQGIGAIKDLASLILLITQLAGKHGISLATLGTLFG